MKKVLVAVLLLAGVCSANVAAESGKWEVGGGPGYSIPVGGDYASGYGGSFNLNVYGAYKLQDPLSVGFEIGDDFSHKGKSDATVNGVTTNLSSLTTRVLQLTPFVKAAKEATMNGKKVNYYGIFGLGMYNVNLASDTAGVDNISKNYLGFNLGGGATMELAPQWSAGLDLRWHHVFASQSAVNNITPTLKVAYTF